jgi:hypothetical protein
MHQLIRRYRDAVTRQELAHWYFSLGRSLVLQGLPQQGRAAIIQAIRLHPSKMRLYPPLFAALLGEGAYSRIRGLWHKWARGAVERDD